jgi:hypothetical protein
MQENNYPKVPLLARSGADGEKVVQVVEVAAIRIRRKRKITE